MEDAFSFFELAFRQALLPYIFKPQSVALPQQVPKVASISTSFSEVQMLAGALRLYLEEFLRFRERTHVIQQRLDEVRVVIVAMQ